MLAYIFHEPICNFHGFLWHVQNLGQVHRNSGVMEMQVCHIISYPFEYHLVGLVHLFYFPYNTLNQCDHYPNEDQAEIDVPIVSVFAMF
jgi:hypothetical protein